MKKLVLIVLFILVLALYACDRVPDFTSTPITEAYENVLYEYHVTARDPDGTAVTLELLEGPAGMYLEDNIIYWTPTVDNIGDHNIRIKASDSSKQTTQEYTLTVHAAISGYFGYYNLSDELAYAVGNATVNISGNGYEETATTDGTGLFYFQDIPQGTYRFDFKAVNGTAYTIYSSDRTFTFLYSARQSTGAAAIRFTTKVPYAEDKIITLLANQKRVTLGSTKSAYTFSGIYASPIEAVTLKQWDTYTTYKLGLKAETVYPKTYMYWNEVSLSNGVTTNMDLDTEAETQWSRWEYTRITAGSYRQEKFGYAFMANTMHLKDLTRQVTITNSSNPNATMNAFLGELRTGVSYGQNHEKIFEWWGTSGWIPYRAMNRSFNFTELGLGINYARNPAVSGSGTMTAYVPAEIQRYDEPQPIDASGEFTVKLDSAEEKEMIYVTQGVGSRPTFSWTAPAFAGHIPEVYVVTVGLVNSGNSITKVIWKGITTDLSIQLPSFATSLLNAGSNYVFYVEAFKGHDTPCTSYNILYYPETYVYWHSRSQGVNFTP